VPNGTDPISIKAEIIPFSIQTVSPNVGGNAGEVTVHIDGAKFDNTTRASLVAEGKEIKATWQRLSRFPKGFNVITGGGPVLKATLSLPSSAIFNRRFSFILEVVNQGNADMPIPVLLVASPNGTPISASPDVQSSSDTQEQIVVLGERRRTFLYPGEHVVIQLYAIALHEPNSQLVVQNLAQPGKKIDWDIMESYYQNGDLPEWNQTWANFRQLVGSTWDSLHDAMRTAADDRSLGSEDKKWAGRNVSDLEPGTK
jgi:hypothetical protein